MRKGMIACGLMTALLVPASASAKPNKQDRQNAAQECRTERGTTPESREAFKQKYGTNANKSNAFGKCVSRTSREEEQQREEARENAAQQCKAERGTSVESRAAFAAKYGTNANKNNAFGKCVSQKAKAEKAEMDAEDQQEIEDRQNAAKQCDLERGETAESREAFRLKYGTNANKSNAFGKCVSQKAQEQEEEPAPQPTA